MLSHLVVLGTNQMNNFDLHLSVYSIVIMLYPTRKMLNISAQSMV